MEPRKSADMELDLSTLQHLPHASALTIARKYERYARLGEQPEISIADRELLEKLHEELLPFSTTKPVSPPSFTGNGSVLINLAAIAKANLPGAQQLALHRSAKRLGDLRSKDPESLTERERQEARAIVTRFGPYIATVD
jgi:hypothetical protein